MKLSKKIFSLLLSLALLFSLLPVLSVSAETSGEWEYRLLDDGTAEITRNTGVVVTSMSIPSTIDGYTVTAIGEYAFGYNSLLKSVTIPNTVTTIGDEAFFGCEGLPSVTIPDSVTSIGSRAFPIATL